MLSLTSQTVGATQGSCFPSPRAITGSKEWAAQFKLIFIEESQNGKFRSRISTTENTKFKKY